jgi:hypothetical protein
MARSFAGGTDRLSYGAWSGVLSSGCLAFWMKSTQATSNACAWYFAPSTASNDGVLFLLNNTAGKVSAYSKISAGDSIILTSTTSVNDGNWHHIAYNWQNGLGSSAALFVDGVQEATGTQSRAWGFSTSATAYFGDANDAFWASYVGDIAESAGYTGRKLDAAEIASLAKGFAPPHVAPAGLAWYWPLVQRAECVRGGSPTSTIGTTVSAHPRIMGSIP